MFIINDLHKCCSYMLIFINDFIINIYISVHICKIISFDRRFAKQF